MSSNQEPNLKKTKLIENPELFINARKPEGELGDELLDWMSQNHEGLAKWGIKHLNIKKDDAILDIGCGSGANIERFLKMTHNRVFGLDYSLAAVEKSIKRNQKAIGQGRCEIILSGVSDMPFKNDTFDIATAFETVYFWPDFSSDLKEVQRVLKKDGVLLICNEAIPKKDDERQNELIDLLDMNIYSKDQLEKYLRQAGFCEVEIFLNEGKDSVTKEYVTWICAVAQK